MVQRFDPDRMAFSGKPQAITDSAPAKYGVNEKHLAGAHRRAVGARRFGPAQRPYLV